jgi:hypothetical protein
MTNPITSPPPELVRQWEEQFLERPTINGCFIQSYIAAKAAQWGADQELEACCSEVQWLESTSTAIKIRDRRRPKPPSLKEQALETLKYPKDLWSESEVDTIRRALEALDD